MIYMARMVTLPDGSHPTEKYAEEMEAGGEGYTMFLFGEPVGCGGIFNHGNGLGEMWGLLSHFCRAEPLALTRGVSRRILPMQQKMGLKIIYARVRKEEPTWNWWLQALRVPSNALESGKSKRFEIKDIIAEDGREYVLYAMSF